MNREDKGPAPVRTILLDFFLVFLYAAILIRPYFKADDEDKWQSIESTFISDARFLAGHWPHPQWQPLWYTGTRFDYIYPPMLRFGTAAIVKLTGFLPVKAYHFYVSFLLRAGNRRRVPTDARRGRSRAPPRGWAR